MHPQEAEKQGVSVRLWDFLFYASFGFVVTSSVAIAGVLLVFCYLIVPSVNAGRGSVLSIEGGIELDAAIMDGATPRRGGCRARTTRAPISLARRLMERGPHVFLSAKAPTSSRASRASSRSTTAGSRPPSAGASWRNCSARGGFDDEVKYGTVGAVAVDGDGHVAAATSTGGLTAKRWGRVGNSPLIGAGTYADDRSAAVSATGSGEYFIRAVAAHQVAERVRLGGEPLQQALDAVLADVAALGGKGGMIAVAPSGEAAWGFTTPAMYRGMADRPAARRNLRDADER